MLTDYWAHMFFDDPKALEEVEDEAFDEDSVADEIGWQPRAGGDADDWETLR